MSIQEVREKINTIMANDAVFTVLLLFMVSFASFGLGRASLAPLQQVAAPAALPAVQQFSGALPEPSSSTQIEVATTAQQYVASKNSNKYHLPWCSGAKRIAEENKIWFSTKEEAEAAGYTPAANCKGI